MKILSICAAALLLLALVELPIAITIASIILAINCFKGSVNIWVVVFGITAIFFNPVIPVYLYQKDKWLPVDLGAAVLFIVYAVIYKTLVKEK